MSRLGPGACPVAEGNRRSQHSRQGHMAVVGMHEVEGSLSSPGCPLEFHRPSVAERGFSDSWCS